jgi:hypothetical protein
MSSQARRDADPPNFSPLLTVVIPVYNEMATYRAEQRPTEYNDPRDRGSD